jgi:hypothetical protein
MKTILLSLIIILLSGATVLHAQYTKRALFLGNSYTGVNNLPAMTATLANSTGDTLIYDSNTPGGYTLQGHSTDPTSMAKIQQANWDYVILQEQSQKPSWPLSQVMTDVFPYAASLCNSIRQANPCTRPMFYMTWGRKNGDSYNCPNWPPVCTYEGMDSLLNLRYRMMGDSNDAYVSPVGAVWHYIRNQYKGIELYAADESHPSVAGSYAAACTFYTLIFQKDPTQIGNDYGLDPVDAANIRNASKIIAYDSLSKWNVGRYVPKAKFAATQNADTIYFSNQSVYANTYFWDFGDGNSSIQENPAHHYTTAGIYQVILIASKCGKADTLTKTIQVVPSSIAQSEVLSYSIYPNPVSDFIILESDETMDMQFIELYSSDGRLVKSFGPQKGKTIRLRCTDLSKGVYFLRFQNGDKIYRHKIIKK